jgi:hypothetical protein
VAREEAKTIKAEAIKAALEEVRTFKIEAINEAKQAAISQMTSMIATIRQQNLEAKEIAREEARQIAEEVAD